MPHVIVKLWLGKSEQQKKRLAQEITHAVMTTLSYGEESVSVGIEEVDANDWMEKVYNPRNPGEAKDDLQEARIGFGLSPFSARRGFSGRDKKGRYGQRR
jgi:4-oxalocrotonate tautomerase